jgi:hypothetical protein
MAAEEIIGLFNEALQAPQSKRSEICERIVMVADHSAEFRNMLSYTDVDQALLIASKYFRIDPNNADTLGAYVRDVLAPKEYHFFYPINQTVNFPDNYKIGFGTGRNFGNLAKNIQRGFEMTWINNFQLYKGIWGDVERYLENRKQAMFLEVVSRASGQFKAARESEAKVEQSLDVLRMTYQEDFVATEYYMELESKPPQTMRGPIHGEYDILPGTKVYNPAHDEKISALNEILTAGRDNEILGRLRTAARLFGAATSSKTQEARYILLCSALDAMVLDDKHNYHGEKLAERIAFISSEPDQRRDTFMQVNDVYSRLPGIILPGSKTEFADKMKSLQELVLKTFWSLVKLEGKGFTSLAMGDGSVVDMIEHMKFSGTAEIPPSRPRSPIR